MIGWESEKFLLSSFEEEKITTDSLTNKEEVEKPRFYRGFFVIKNWLPFPGEPYRSSKPIAGILRSKPRVNRNVL